MKPGPSRPVTLTDAERRRLVATAKRHGLRAEKLRQQMMAAAHDRQAAIRQLRDGGLSVRDVAAELGVSPAVVQHALTAKSRPTLVVREGRLVGVAGGGLAAQQRVLRGV